jgi:hypothetical protein
MQIRHDGGQGYLFCRRKKNHIFLPFSTRGQINVIEREAEESGAYNDEFKKKNE